MQQRRWLKLLIGLGALGIVAGAFHASTTPAQACPPAFYDVTNDACRVNVVAGTISVTSAPSTNTFTSATAVYATITSIPSVVVATGTNQIGTVLQGLAPWTVNATVTGVPTVNISTSVNIPVTCTGCSAASAVSATITNVPAVSQSGTWNIASITGAPLAVNCTGCSAASVVTATVTAASVTIVGCSAGVCATTGQTNMASSTSVTMANNQTAIPVISTSTVIATGTNSMGSVTIASAVNIPVTCTGCSAASVVTSTITAAAMTTIPAAASDGAGVGIKTDKFGRLINVPQGDRALATFGMVPIATTVETVLIPAAGASTFWDITSLFCSNTNSASGTRVDIRDTTGGTIRHSAWLAGNGGGFVLPLFVPFPQQSANATWTAQLSVNVTDVRCNFVAMKNK